MALESQSVFIQSGNESAEQCRRALASIMGGSTGVGAGGDFVVTQNGTPNMSVNVAAGDVWIPGTQAATQGAYYIRNLATANVPIAAVDPTNPRISVICVTQPDAQYSGILNTPVLQEIAGTPAASPTVPALPPNSYALANVNVAASASSIVNANITNKRAIASTRQAGSTTLFGASGPLVGSLPNPLAGAPFLPQAWGGSASSNGFGGFGVNFPTAFPNGVLYVDIHLTFPGTNPGWVLKQKGWTTSGVSGVLDTFTSSGLITSTSFTYNAFAMGW